MSDKSRPSLSAEPNCVVHLIISLDYEIFGNGSGRLDCCVTQPTERIARLVESFGGRLSVFVDTCEFQAMAAEAATASAVAEVDCQLRTLAGQGHYLELHLHPQWTGDALLVDRRWELDFDKWRVGDRSAPELQVMVRSGLTWLRQLAGASTRSRRPVAFRAGGWCVQPSSTLISVLAQHGFSVESSVAPGLWSSERASWYDFRRHPGLPEWPVGDDVCQAKLNGEIWEVPIAVGKIPRLYHLQSIARSRGRFAPGCQGSYSRGHGSFIRAHSQFSRLRQLGRSMLDFSTLDGSMLIAVAEDWVNRHAGSGTVVPLVAIGHTKNFTADSLDSLKQFLDWAAADARVCFSDYQTLMESRRARS